MRGTALPGAELDAPLLGLVEPMRRSAVLPKHPVVVAHDVLDPQNLFQDADIIFGVVSVAQISDIVEPLHTTRPNIMTDTSSLGHSDRCRKHP